MELKTFESTSFGRVAQEYLMGGVSSSFRINPFTGKPMGTRGFSWSTLVLDM